MSGIYFDEHRKYQIDLRKTIWSTDGLHRLYTCTIGNVLSDEQLTPLWSTLLG